MSSLIPFIMKVVHKVSRINYVLSGIDIKIKLRMNLSARAAALKRINGQTDE